MKFFTRVSCLLCLVCLLLAGYANAATGEVIINHQGRLLDASDAPVTNGIYPFRFTIWTDSTSGSQVWLELQDISVQKGLFTTGLGRSTDLGSVVKQYPNQPLFLQTQVTINGASVTLSPRMRIGTVPCAVLAKRVADDTVSTGGEAIFTNANPAGSTELRVIPLNGLPPGTPVTGVALTANTDSATVGITGTDAGTLKSEYTAKAGKTGATKRMVYQENGNELSTDEQVDADSAMFSSSVEKFGELKGLISGTTSLQGSGTNSRLAIKTKGTGAQRSSCTADVLDDGASSSSAAFRAINTKGTGATVRVIAQASDSGATSTLDADDDGDALLDEEMQEQCGNDSIIVTHSVYDHGALLTQYKATQGKTGATKRMIHQEGSDKTSSSESLDADSAVFQQSYSSGAKLLSYTAKAGKTGSAKRTINQNGSSGSSSSEFSDADSVVYADSIFDNGATAASYKATQGKTGATKRLVLVSGSVGSSSYEISGTDSITTVDSFLVNGATAASYKATQGKTGATKRTTNQNGSSESSSSEFSDADSAVSDDTYSHGGALQADYTAKTGKTGKFQKSLVVDGDDESSASENHTVDSITHDESVTVNGVVVSQYKAKKGISGSTKRTIQHTGTTTYASNEEVDNNGARMYMTTDNGNPGTPLDTGFYADNAGNFRISGNGAFGIEINNAGTTNVNGRLGIGVSSPSNPLELASGAHCTAGGVFTNASDVNLKENFKPVNDEAILDKVEQLPISQWNYKNESDDVTHIGPTAQDFKAVFGVGDNDKSISTIDPAGIALVAIKELRKENRGLKSENEELKKRLDDLQKKVEALLSKK